MGDTNSNRLGGDKAGTGDGISSRKHRSPAGSAFRIESPGELRRSLHSAAPEQSQSHWHGKRKSDGAEPKKQSRRHHRQHSHDAKPSVGNSPLGKEVKNASPAGDGSRAPSGGTPSPNLASSGTPSQTDFDKDTTQLVNLALNLSESRRRMSSGRTFTSPSLRERRVASASLPQSSAWDTQRQSKRRDHSWQFTPSAHAGSSQTPGHSQQPTIAAPHFSETAVPESDENYDFSDATLTRAQKTRRHFELFEEYLRLLPHLPRLRAPGERHRSSLSGTSDENGRVYNPLQYIRNRKVRYRERTAINTEGGSWEDSEKVHNWVDNIMSSDEKRQSSNHPDICLRLPPVEPGHRIEDSIGAMSPTSPGSGHARGSENKKPRRPSKDWVISPSDLLADVAWLEKDSNKAKIEDRDGNKIFPPGAEFKVVSSGGGSEPLETPQNEEEQDSQRDRGNGPADAPSTFESAASSQNPSRAGRGRRKQRLAHSLSLTPSHSHSRISSKSRLRKALSGSNSTSSLDISDDAVRRKRLAEAHADIRGQPDMFSAGPQTEIDKPVKPGLHDAPEHKPGLLDTDLHLGTQREIASPQSPQDYNNGRDRRLLSHARTQSIASSSVSDNNNRDGARRSSIDEIETAPSSPTHAARFPSIAINLTPSHSRSVSPNNSPQTFGRGHKHDDGKNPQSDATTDRHFRDYDLPTFEHVPQDASSPPRRQTAPYDRPESHDFRRIDSLPTKLRKGASNQESKVRGMFKGGRIAELIGGEVSRVGDFIRKREPGHSRQSSSASSIKSEFSPAGDDVDASNGKPELHSRRASLEPCDNDVLQHDSQYVSSPPKAHAEQLQPAELSENDQSSASLDSVTRHDVFATPPKRKDDSAQPHGVGDKLRPDEYTSGVDKVTFRSTYRELEPVVESPRSGISQRKPIRPKLSETTRNWSMSSHSITKVDGSKRVGKRDIAAIRAHLLSSGTKALQIRRTCKSPGGPCTLNGPTEELNGQPLNAVTSGEATASARKLVASFDGESATIRQSMSTLSCEKVPSLISDLERLDTLISSSLTPRMRKTNLEADHLTSELATTSTLSIKQLNDALDRGIRKRNRRFRRMSRLGFVLLEWCLVGAMWFVWMVVMMLKVTRGIWRGAVSGIRWVLWL